MFKLLQWLAGVSFLTCINSGWDFKGLTNEILLPTLLIGPLIGVKMATSTIIALLARSSAYAAISVAYKELVH